MAGTAMGTHMAPGYANIFLGEFEAKPVQNAPVNEIARL